MLPVRIGRRWVCWCLPVWWFAGEHTAERERESDNKNSAAHCCCCCVKCRRRITNHRSRTRRVVRRTNCGSGRKRRRRKNPSATAAAQPNPHCSRTEPNRVNRHDWHRPNQFRALFTTEKPAFGRFLQLGDRWHLGRRHWRPANRYTSQPIDRKLAPAIELDVSCRLLGSGWSGHPDGWGT